MASGKIYIKTYETEKGTMIAMCDEELLGKEFGDGKAKLDLNRYASFYKGELQEEGKISIDMESIYSANVVGERSVAIMIRTGVATEDEIKRVSGIPFLQVYRVLGAQS
ncbi:MAG: DUF424 family protein [Candidatus Micrarchaeota archaeon]|nr:DUF424 family protein [Candidatus Micrarchaeota archaeon]